MIGSLSKVYKISGVCTTLSDCGLPDKFYGLDGTELEFAEKVNIGKGSSSLYDDGTGGNIIDSYDIPETKPAAFQTINGESIALYYNPECKSDSTVSHYVQSRICVNMIYDLNGKKAPNKIGSDMGFITVLYPTDSSVVAPMPYTEYASSERKSFNDATAACNEQSDKVGIDLRLPDRDELAAMFINNKLFGESMSGDDGDGHWSGSVISAGGDGLAWYQGFRDGKRADFQGALFQKRTCYKM